MKKVMVGIQTTAAKKTLLTTLIEMGYDFVEYSSYEDFKFKFDLLAEHIAMVVHELNYNTYYKDFEFYKSVQKPEIPGIALIHKYDAKVIDDAMRAGIQDIMVLPLKPEVIRNKIDSMVRKKVEQEIAKEEDVKFDISVVDAEIQRAHRGNYSLSMVLYELSGASDEEIGQLMEALKGRLRETDIQIRCASNRILLICPFTVKDDIVEVENKLRRYVKENMRSFSNKVELWLYGLSYPKDGSSTEALMQALNEGLRNSIFLGSLKGSFNDLGKNELEQYRNLFKKRDS